MLKKLSLLIPSFFFILNLLSAADALQPSFISGTVRSAFNNTLIPSSTVITTSGYFASAPSGLFHITVPPNIYSIIVSAQGFSSNIHSGIFATPGQTFNAETWLTPASRELSYIQGRVIDLKTGNPIENALIVSRHGDAAITDQAGAFSMTAETGKTTLTAFAKGFSSKKAVDLTLRPFTIKQVLFYLEDAPVFAAQVSGTIRNACTGERIPNASLLSPDGKVIVAEDGFYAVDLPSGLSTLIATAPGFQFRHRTIELVPFIPYIINFDMIPADTGFGKVTGTISNALTGETLQDARVETDTGHYTYTRSDGRYALYTSTCASFIQVSKQGFMNKRDSVSVAYGISVSKNMTLRPLASVHGIVKDTGNLPLTGVAIYLEEDRAVSTLSLAKGVYRLDNIAPGTYNIIASHPCFETGSAPITVSSGQLLSRDLFLDPNPEGVLYGSVNCSLTGIAIAGAELYTGYGRAFRTDDSGNYTIDLPSGTTSVSAAASGYLSEKQDVEILQDARQQLSFELIPCPLDFIIEQTGPDIFPYSEIFRIYRDRHTASDPELKWMVQQLYTNAGAITLTLYTHRHLREMAAAVLFESFVAMMTHNRNLPLKNSGVASADRIHQFLDEFLRHTKRPELIDLISAVKKRIDTHTTDR